MLWILGCPSTVNSIQDPKRKVTRAELQAEIDYMLSIAEVRFKDLEKLDQLKKILFNSSVLLASGGTVNPIGVVTSIAAILGVGATVDNVRKRKKLKEVITYDPIARDKDNPTNPG